MDIGSTIFMSESRAMVFTLYIFGSVYPTRPTVAPLTEERYSPGQACGRGCSSPTLIPLKQAQISCEQHEYLNQEYIVKHSLRTKFDENESHNVVRVRNCNECGLVIGKPYI